MPYSTWGFARLFSARSRILRLVAAALVFCTSLALLFTAVDAVGSNGGSTFRSTLWKQASQGVRASVWRWRRPPQRASPVQDIAGHACFSSEAAQGAAEAAIDEKEPQWLHEEFEGAPWDASSTEWTVVDEGSEASDTDTTPTRTRRRYRRSRPIDVKKWQCQHVARWLGDQRWKWKELASYQQLVCDVGVDGALLYSLDDLDLAQDLQVRYRLHRKLILDAIAELRRQQPEGSAEPGNLWEYIHDDPTRAALYVSGVLCTPRLTMLWLYVFEYSTTLGPLLADEDEGSSQAAYSSPMTIQEFLVLFSLKANQIVFWLGWFFCPAMLVAYHAVLCADFTLVLAAYVLLISVLKQLTEAYSLFLTLFRPQVCWSDKVASWVCSHMMTPALSMMLAVLHLVFSQVMPSWAWSMMFWVRILVLPPLSIWASWASWAPIPESEAAAHRLQQAPAVPSSPCASDRDDAPGTHWPLPIRCPPELDDEPDVPSIFRCPITHDVMRQPAISPSGVSYEYAAIVEWLACCRAGALDPVTKAPLTRLNLVPNLALRMVIQDWISSRLSARGVAPCIEKQCGVHTWVDTDQFVHGATATAASMPYEGRAHGGSGLRYRASAACGAAPHVRFRPPDGGPTGYEGEPSCRRSAFVAAPRDAACRAHHASAASAAERTVVADDTVHASAFAGIDGVAVPGRVPVHVPVALSCGDGYSPRCTHASTHSRVHCCASATSPLATPEAQHGFVESERRGVPRRGGSPTLAHMQHKHRSMPLTWDVASAVTSPRCSMCCSGGFCNAECREHELSGGVVAAAAAQAHAAGCARERPPWPVLSKLNDGRSGVNHCSTGKACPPRTVEPAPEPRVGQPPAMELYDEPVPASSPSARSTCAYSSRRVDGSDALHGRVAGCSCRGHGYEPGCSTISDRSLSGTWAASRPVSDCPHCAGSSRRGYSTRRCCSGGAAAVVAGTRSVYTTADGAVPDAQPRFPDPYGPAVLRTPPT